MAGLPGEIGGLCGFRLYCRGFNWHWHQELVGNVCSKQADNEKKHRQVRVREYCVVGVLSRREMYDCNKQHCSNTAVGHCLYVPRVCLFCRPVLSFGGRYVFGRARKRSRLFMLVRRTTTAVYDLLLLFRPPRSYCCTGTRSSYSYNLVLEVVTLSRPRSSFIYSCTIILSIIRSSVKCSIAFNKYRSRVCVCETRAVEELCREDWGWSRQHLLRSQTIADVEARARSIIYKYILCKLIALRCSIV